MIKSFKCKETEKIFNRIFSKNFPSNIQALALRKILMIHAAENIEDLRVPPGNNLEKLKGNLRGLHSIRVNKKWRICFEWRDGNAYLIEIVDYH